MKELIGKKIVGAYMSSDKTQLGFMLEGGERQAYITDGDCCSYSWVEHFSNSEYLAGARVVDVQEIAMPDMEHPDHECLSCYGVKVILEGRPAFEFEYRNSSNGYYGGYISKAELNDGDWRKLILMEDFERLLVCSDVLHS